MRELFLTIFNAAVTAGWLVLAVLAARLLLRRVPAWIKCALWAVVALRLVWPFEIESILSLVPSRETVSVETLTSPTPSISTGIPVMNDAINPGVAQVFTPMPGDSVNPLQVATAVAAWVWIAGMAGMVLYTAVSYLRLYRRVRVRVPVEKGVYLSDGVQSPFILGFFRPKIYLPSDLPEEKWGAVLSHERAHIARKDHWWKPLGFFLLTVFWFHPLLWVAYILLCRDVEQACDEKVIKNLTAEEKQNYSNILLECSVPRKWVSACPLAFGESNIKRRIKAVLHYKKPTVWILIAALLLGTVLAVCFLTDPMQEAENPTEPVSFQIAGKTYIYEKPGFYGPFTIDIEYNGTFTYYVGYASSYIGHGIWERKDSKLYLYDNGLSVTKTFAFEIENDCLMFLSAESDQFMYLAVSDGERFFAYERTEVESSSLIYVTVIEKKTTYFIGMDVLGNKWKIRYKNAERIKDVSHCWVKYYGSPTELEGEPLQYTVEATACWQYREDDPRVSGRIFDTVRFDVDGDGFNEECILSEGGDSKLFRCRLTVWNGENCEYDVCVDELLRTGENSFGMIPSVTPTIGVMWGCGNVYAFAFQDGNLIVVTPWRNQYFETGQFTTFRVGHIDGNVGVWKIA